MGVAGAGPDCAPGLAGRLSAEGDVTVPTGPEGAAEALPAGGTDDVPDCKFGGVGLVSERAGVTPFAWAAVPDAGISAGAVGVAVVCAKATVADRLARRA